MAKRITDVNGDIINEPEHYSKAREAVIEMLEKMDSENVDKADMYVAISNLITESHFYVRFHLEDRKGKNAKNR